MKEKRVQKAHIAQKGPKPKQTKENSPTNKAILHTCIIYFSLINIGVHTIKRLVRREGMSERKPTSDPHTNEIQKAGVTAMRETFGQYLIL